MSCLSVISTTFPGWPNHRMWKNVPGHDIVQASCTSFSTGSYCKLTLVTGPCSILNWLFIRLRICSANRCAAVSDVRLITFNVHERFVRDDRGSSKDRLERGVLSSCDTGDPNGKYPVFDILLLQ
jgi:hypothetical protein